MHRLVSNTKKRLGAQGQGKSRNISTPTAMAQCVGTASVSRENLIELTIMISASKDKETTTALERQLKIDPVSDRNR